MMRIMMRMMKRRMMNNFIVFLLVVLNPYQGIDYNRINVYNLKSSNHQINVIKPEKEIKKEVNFEEQFCFLCNPPQFIRVEKWEYK